MKRVLRKQRSALKFLASAKPSYQASESVIPVKVLLTPNESDKLFVTLEEDFNDILKTSPVNETSNLEKRMQKLWSLISMIRKNEVILRDLCDKKDMKTISLKLTKTVPALKTYNYEKDALSSKDVKKSEGESPKSGEFSSKSSITVSESELAASKEMFEREKHYLLKEIISLKEKLMKSTESIQELYKKICKNEELIKELKNDLEVQTTETIKELKLRQNYENRVKEMQKQIDVREKEMVNLSHQCNNTKEQLKLLETTVNEQKLTNELLIQNNSHLSQKIVKLQSEYNSQTIMLEELTQKYTSLSNQTKIYEENSIKMLSDINKNSKLKEVSQKKIQSLEAQKKELTAEKEKVITNMNFLEKEIENWRKKYENEKRITEDLKREKELLLKNYQRANAASDEQQRILKIEVRMKDQLECDVNHLNMEVLKHNDSIYFLEREKARLKSKNGELQTKLDEMQEHIQEKESLMLELKKQLNSLEVTYRHQTSLLENERNEKIMYFQNLTQAKEEMVDLKQKIKIMTQKIDEEKENVVVKECELLKEKSVLQKLEQDKEKLYGEITLCKETIRRTNQHINELLETEKKLNSIIRKMETEFQKKDKHMLQVIGEQELISTQLLLKIEEIGQLNAKLKLCEITHEQRISESKEHAEEIRCLKSEIKRLKTDKVALNRNLSAVASLRSEMFALQRELTMQKVKCRALEEELQNPLNIHRWRKLKGTDPNTYDMITKIHLLQKQLLTKSEIAAGKEEQLKELETLYENLQNVTANLSPAEVSNKLYFLKKRSEEKSKKIKSLTVELSMYESHTTECKLELERKTKELEKIKSDFFKKKQLLFRSKYRKPKNTPHECHTNNDVNKKSSAMGGGFLTKPALGLPVIQIYDQN